MWKKGESGNPAGSKPGSGVGRPADWLRAECQKHAPNLLKFLASVANGDDVEQAVGSEGEIIRVPAAVRDRVKATEILLNRGYGMPNQALDITQHDEVSRPSTEALLQTVTVLRRELDGLRAGTRVAAGK